MNPNPATGNLNATQYGAGSRSNVRRLLAESYCDPPGPEKPAVALMDRA